MVFVLLGVTSQQWATRDYYDSPVPEDWGTPNFTIYRNPFKLCTLRPRFNETRDDEGVLHKVITGFNNSCQSYSPSGTNSTSCELPWVLATYRNLTNTLADAPAIRGDARLCQQIHYAGNFAISGTVFITFGALMTICMTLAASYAFVSKFREPQISQHSHVTTKSAGKMDAQETVGETDSNTSSPRNSSKRNSIARSFNFVNVSFLRIGVILILLSQYYGTQGLIQSSPNNADFASSAFGTASADDSNIFGFHGPWYQGRGLSVYMTCAWAFALATSTLAAKLWRT